MQNKIELPQTALPTSTSFAKLHSTQEAHMSKRYRSGLITLFIIALLIAVLPSTHALAHNTTSATQAVGESPDYASQVFGDPWDYNNPEDVIVDNGPVINANQAALINGELVIDFKQTGHFHPLWPGWPDDQSPTRAGALRLGRDGANQPINADEYTKISFLEHTNSTEVASIAYATCPQLEVASCWHSVDYRMQPGWLMTTIDMKAATAHLGSGRWAGKIYGVRHTTTMAGPSQVKFDWMRIHAAGTQIDLSQAAERIAYEPWHQIAADGTVKALGQYFDDRFVHGSFFDRFYYGVVYWDSNDNDDDNVPGAKGWGTLPGLTLDSGALPPGTYRFGSSPTNFTHTLTVEAAPRLVIDNPDVKGGEDYATAVLGNAWDFNEPSDVASVGNITNVQFRDGWMHATNSGPHHGDPYIVMRDNGNLQANRYHRVTIKATYDGPFDLKLTAGGGMHGRISWRQGNDITWKQTAEVVMHKHEAEWTIPLNDYAYGHDLMEPDMPNQPMWNAPGGPIHSLRWDANEDLGPRQWKIDEIRLSADDEAFGNFNIEWHDNNFAPGTTIDLFADTNREGFQGTQIASNLTPQQAKDSFNWQVNIPNGTYWVWAKVTSPRGLATQKVYATGPLQVRGQSAAPQPSVDPYGDLRAAGQSRVETAVELSKLSYPYTANTVLLATAATYPDALAAAPLAAQVKAPILLTQPDSLHASTLAELQRLQARTVLVLGGKNAVSDAIVSQLQGLGMTVERLAGASRIETAINIARYSATHATSKPTKAFVTAANRFEDALAISSLAIQEGAPIFLTGTNDIDPHIVLALRSMNINDVTFVSSNGPDLAVPRQALFNHGFRVNELASATPAGLSARVANMLDSTLSDTAVVASSANFPDALAAGPTADALGGFLVLTDPVEQDHDVVNVVRNKKIKRLVVAGGKKAIPVSAIKPLDEVTRLNR